MKKGVYYKLLTASGKSPIVASLRRRGRARGKCIHYPLPKDGKPGEWIKIPAPGTFVMRLNSDFTWPHRYSGKLILVRLECRGLSGKKDLRRGKCMIFTPTGTRCFREVRVVEIIPLETLPSTAGYWRRSFATLFALSRDARAKMVLGISPTLPDDRLSAAVYTSGLMRAERWELVSTLPADPAYRCYAAMHVRGLSASQRAELVKNLTWTDKMPRSRMEGDER